MGTKFSPIRSNLEVKELGKSKIRVESVNMWYFKEYTNFLERYFMEELKGRFAFTKRTTPHNLAQIDSVYLVRIGFSSLTSNYDIEQGVNLELPTVLTRKHNGFTIKKSFGRQKKKTKTGIERTALEESVLL